MDIKTKASHRMLMEDTTKNKITQRDRKQRDGKINYSSNINDIQNRFKVSNRKRGQLCKERPSEKM